MSTMKIHAVVEADGELHLRGLPYRKGEQVEATLVVQDPQAQTPEQAAALQRFIEQAKSSKFRSEGPYPTRDELHERR